MNLPFHLWTSKSSVFEWQDVIAKLEALKVTVKYSSASVANRQRWDEFFSRNTKEIQSLMEYVVLWTKVWHYKVIVMTQNQNKGEQNGDKI